MGGPAAKAAGHALRAPVRCTFRAHIRRAQRMEGLASPGEGLCVLRVSVVSFSHTENLSPLSHRTSFPHFLGVFLGALGVLSVSAMRIRETKAHLVVNLFFFVAASLR